MLSMQENFSDPQVRSFVYMVFRDLTQKTCSSLMVVEEKNLLELQISNSLESLEVSRVDGSSICKLGAKNSISLVFDVDVTFVMRPQTE